MDAVNLSEKYIFLDLRSWEINIARTARRLGVSRNTVRHLQSLSSEEVLQQKERHYKLHAYEQAVASLLISLPSISSSRIGDYLREHYEVHYIILRASKEETLKRAVERSKLDRKTNIELVETMWEQFCNLGIYESNVVDTTNYSIQETVSAVQEKIASRAALLS